MLGALESFRGCNEPSAQLGGTLGTIFFPNHDLHTLTIGARVATVCRITKHTRQIILGVNRAPHLGVLGPITQFVVTNPHLYGQRISLRAAKLCRMTCRGPVPPSYDSEAGCGVGGIAGIYELVGRERGFKVERRDNVTAHFMHLISALQWGWHGLHCFVSCHDLQKYH